jgi:hypothetical protein
MQYIQFEIDHWDENGNHSKVTVIEKVHRISVDPSGRHESKYIVNHDGALHGIPSSNALQVPGKGDQLRLKF